MEMWGAEEEARSSVGPAIPHNQACRPTMQARPKLRQHPWPRPSTALRAGQHACSWLCAGAPRGRRGPSTCPRTCSRQHAHASGPCWCGASGRAPRALPRAGCRAGARPLRTRAPPAGIHTSAWRTSRGCARLRNPQTPRFLLFPQSFSFFYPPVLGELHVDALHRHALQHTSATGAEGRALGSGVASAGWSLSGARALAVAGTPNGAAAAAAARHSIKRVAGCWARLGFGQEECHEDRPAARGGGSRREHDSMQPPRAQRPRTAL